MPIVPPDVLAAFNSSADRRSLGRRTERMLRVLLVLVGIYHPLMAVWMGWRQGIGLDPLLGIMATLQTALCITCLLAQHRGNSTQAAMGFVLTQVLLLTVAYGYWGLGTQVRMQLPQVIPVLLVSAVLGGRVLWWITFALCAILLLGAWVDAAAALFDPIRVRTTATDLSVSGFGVLLTAWLLQQSVTGLRESLKQSRRHGLELAQKRDQLQLEIQEKERSRDQLVHAVKMDNVGRLASGIAHDFNHLLALVQAYVSKARRSDSPDTRAEALQGADSALRRAAAVSRRLLDFGRLEASRPQLFDPATAVASMSPMLHQVFERNVQCSVNIDAASCQIHFDRAQLEMILISIAANASQAMPDGGRFDLVLNYLPRSEVLEISASDTGLGMNEEVRQQCLQPFFTTKPSGQGTGLGLAVAFNLISEAGGSMRVDSAPGVGSTFRIRLPAQPAAVESVND